MENNITLDYLRKMEMQKIGEHIDILPSSVELFFLRAVCRDNCGYIGKEKCRQPRTVGAKIKDIS